MSFIIPQELNSIMEATLLTDATILQAKIVDIAAFDAPNQDLVVAISIHPDVQQSDADALRTARRALVRKLRNVGGKAVVPKKWVRRSELPVAADGEVDELALKQTLVADVLPTTPEVPVESVDEKIMRIVSKAIGVPQDQLIQTRSFAQNGGDSFTAIQVFQGLMREDVSLRVPDIMACETLAELPALVISRSAPATPDAVPNAQQAPAEVHQIRLPAVESRRVSVTTITV